MNTFNSPRFSYVFLALLAVAILALSRPAQAQENWHATVGAQSANDARQVLAFLPNEIWVHVGDTITWTVAADEIHTITFLKAGQPRPPFAVGCPGFSVGTATFNGSLCVSTPPTAKGQTFTVKFPKAGNYRLVCLVHPGMTGVIHVLNASDTLPHDQDFYDDEAAAQRRALLSDKDGGMGASKKDHEGQDADNQDRDSNDNMLSVRVLSKSDSQDENADSGAQVTAGVGEIHATPGGNQAISVLRFLKGTITIHAGDTVEWSNSDPSTPHTITFGTEPANPIPPSGSVVVTVDADGARHATITSPGDSVNSGFIVAAPQERTGLPQAPLPPAPNGVVTRFRVTFTQPGTYNYICALHDNLGMVGKVIVVP